MILYRVFFSTSKQVQQTVGISLLPEQQTLWNNSLVHAGTSSYFWITTNGRFTGDDWTQSVLDRLPPPSQMTSEISCGIEFCWSMRNHVLLPHNSDEPTRPAHAWRLRMLGLNRQHGKMSRVLLSSSHRINTGLIRHNPENGFFIQ